MLAVIADDLTGAAEIGGLALRHKLSVEINTKVNAQSNADLLIVSTDTRSMNQQEAESVIKKVITDLIKLNPTLIFKKIDSVLRGHVIPEINILLKELNLNKALIVPANPSLGRTIVDGNYYFNSELIHLSSFSKDPEFAIKSSDVKKMVRSNKETVQVFKHYETLLNEGIFIGEVKHQEDINSWASLIDHRFLAVGAGDFFLAILNKRNIPLNDRSQNNKIEFGSPLLFVSGTTFNRSVETIIEIKQNNGPVSYMPKAIVLANDLNEIDFQNWSNEIVSFISTQKKAVIAIDNNTTIGTNVTALSLRQKMAKCVQLVINKITVHELFIEGGSTASAIIEILNLNCFYPTHEIIRGVTRMQVDKQPDLHITVKPGSYDWPKGIFN